MPPLSDNDRVVLVREPITIWLLHNRTGYVVVFDDPESGREEEMEYLKCDAESFVTEIVSAILWETLPSEVDVRGERELVKLAKSLLRPTWW